MNVVLFGAGEYGKMYLQECDAETNVIAVLDNSVIDDEKRYMGYKTFNPKHINKFDFDKVVIAINEHSQNGQKYIFEMHDQLIGLGVPDDKIELISKDYYQEMRVEYPRIEFLYSFSRNVHERNIQGAIAECGVCFGDFAHKMNKFFSDRTLYLFDTFSSFDDRDFAMEPKDYSQAVHARSLLASADPRLVYMKMTHKKNIIIKQGYVPETFADMGDEKFCFVNLDMDLYAPTLAGLKFFHSRMNEGGVILVHDYYFEKGLDGVKIAVDEFLHEHNYKYVPIGDRRSIAIIF